MAAALEGVRVVELGHIMAGPVCGRMLADLGADVVKVEPPRGDPTRGYVSTDQGGQSAAFVMLNRNKRGLALDLKNPDGVRAMRQILSDCDVVVENFRPGVMDDLGLGYERLRETNPGLIYCQITGFGRTGPLSELGGFDLIAQGMTGLLSVTGEGPGRPPTKCGPPVTDITAGLLGALGVLAALHARATTGAGQRVDTSLYQAGVFLTLWHSSIAFATGQSPGPLGSAHPLAAPYEAFATSDGWITVGGSNQAAWIRLVETLDLEELADDPRFRTNPDRMVHLAELREALSERFKTHSTEVWLRRLTEAKVPAGPVVTIQDMLAHPQATALGMILNLPGAGDDRTLGTPVQLSATPTSVALGAPGLGQDTDAVLGEYGFTLDEVAELKRLEAAF